MPSLTAYFECRAVTCTFSQLNSEAIQDAEARGEGRYHYLLGDVVHAQLYEVNVWYIPANPQDGVYYSVLRVTQGSPPVDYATQFTNFATTAAEGEITITVPPSVSGGFPADAGAMADVSTYLRQQPIFNNVFVALDHPVITVEFSNGDTAKFVYVSSVSSTGVAFQYVPGSAKDKNGNKISESAVLGNNVSVILGTEFNSPSAISISGGELIITGIKVYIDPIGIITVGPATSLCDSGGNCVTQ